MNLSRESKVTYSRAEVNPLLLELDLLFKSYILLNTLLGLDQSCRGRHHLSVDISR